MGLQLDPLRKQLREMMLEYLTEVLLSLLFHMLNLSQVEWMKGRSHTF
ncbi:unnamed protein product, partial [Brassica napus]